MMPDQATIDAWNNACEAEVFTFSAAYGQEPRHRRRRRTMRQCREQVYEGVQAAGLVTVGWFFLQMFFPSLARIVLEWAKKLYDKLTTIDLDPEK